MVTKKKAATPKKRAAVKPKATAKTESVDQAEVERAEPETPAATPLSASPRETAAAAVTSDGTPEDDRVVRQEAEPFQRPAEPAEVTNVPVGRFPAEDTPEPGSEFQPAPGRFPEE